MNDTVKVFDKSLMELFILERAIHNSDQIDYQELDLLIAKEAKEMRQYVMGLNDIEFDRTYDGVKKVALYGAAAILDK